MSDIEKIGLLTDPIRRSLYELVIASEPDDVSRDRAAEALGVRRGLAAFHLDKLVTAGLLETRFSRPAGVGGPGAGRPTKYYRRSRSPIEISLPPRRYDLMGGFLVEGVVESAALARARRAARSFGRKLAAPKARLFEFLEEQGFEPLRQGKERVVLRNCPFYELAATHKDTVCEINLAFHEGFARALGEPGLSVVRNDEPGRCCVAYSLKAS